MGKDKRTKADLIAELENLQASTDGTPSGIEELLSKVNECGDSMANFHELRDSVIKKYEVDSRKALTIINNCKSFIQSSNNLKQLLDIE